MPEEAKHSLSASGKIIEFTTKDITYEAVSGHPDIFFFQAEDTLICAPNLPEKYFQIMKENKTGFITGENCVGSIYPHSAHYNCVLSENYFIHNRTVTDRRILERIKDKTIINVRQGYTRCSLLPLRNNSFITSDKGIEKTLKLTGADVLYVPSEDVLLPGFKNGFFCGACGVLNNTVFITGSLKEKSEGTAVRTYLSKKGYDIKELYNGPVFDCGSIFFIEGNG